MAEPAAWSRSSLSRIALAGVVILAGAGLPLPGYSVSPGRTTDAGDLIAVNGREVFEPEGTFLVSTVALKPLRPSLAVQAWLDDSVTTVPKAVPRLSGPQYSGCTKATSGIGPSLRPGLRPLVGSSR